LQLPQQGQRSRTIAAVYKDIQLGHLQGLAVLEGLLPTPQAGQCAPQSPASRAIAACCPNSMGSAGKRLRPCPVPCGRQATDGWPVARATAHTT
jgi:hypothetical protein